MLGGGLATLLDIASAFPYIFHAPTWLDREKASAPAHYAPDHQRF